MSGIEIEQFTKELVTMVLAIAGLITALGGAFAVIHNWINKSKSHRNAEAIATHEEKLRDHEERLTSLEKRNEVQDNFIKVMCNAMLAILDHNINGNSIDKLKDARKEMREFLINEKKPF